MGHYFVDVLTMLRVSMPCCHDTLEMLRVPGEEQTKEPDSGGDGGLRACAVLQYRRPPQDSLRASSQVAPGCRQGERVEHEGNKWNVDKKLLNPIREIFAER